MFDLYDPMDPANNGEALVPPAPARPYLTVEPPEGMSGWLFVVIVAWCTLLAILKTTWLVVRHPLSFVEKAKQEGYVPR